MDALFRLEFIEGKQYITKHSIAGAIGIDITAKGREYLAETKSNTHTIIHGDQYKIGQAAAVGPHSTGTLNNQPQWTAIQNQADLNAVASELEKLKSYLHQTAKTVEDYAQLQLVVQAKEAAEKQDGNKAMEFLAKGGKAFLDVATDFGAKVTAEITAKLIGLG